MSVGPSAAAPPAADFGPLLRRWRQQRRRSQLELALDAGTSTRHLSFIETGKARPSRAMVLRLADELDVPLRERNALLLAAGYAPAFPERPLADPALAEARATLQRLLDAHEPNPALAVDRHWNLVAHNRLVPLLLAGVVPALRTPPVNVLRALLHPQGLAGAVDELPRWRRHVLGRLRRQIAATADPALRALHAELQALPGADGRPWPPDDDDADAHELVLPLALHLPGGPPLRFVGTVTVFGGPHDVTLAELAVETFLAADEATAARLRALLAAAADG